MAITITERWSGKTKTRGDSDSDTATRIFDVIGAANDDAALDAVAGTGFGLPGVYISAPYSSSIQYLCCKSITVRDISVGIHEVTANYAIGNFVQPENPTKLPWKYKWQNVTIEPPFDRDINGNAIVNSARNPPTNAPTKRISYKSLQITRYETFYNYALYKTYENTTNSDSISLLQPDGNSTTFGPGTIFCVSIEPQNAYTQLDNYLIMVLNFEIWDLSLLPSSVNDPFQLHLSDVGPNGYWNNGGTITQGALWTNKGNQCTCDQQLNGLGKPVDATLTVEGNTPVQYSGSPPAGATIENPTANAYYLKYYRYQSQAFIPLLAEPAQSPSNIES